MKYVVSDIHGNMEAWRSIKSQIKLRPMDDLYILGDVIDRGKHGIDILSEIMVTKNMHMVLGNHEYMMMNVIGYPYTETDPELKRSVEQRRSLWYSNGGKITHDEYNKLDDAYQRAIGKFLQSLPLSISVKVNGTRYILVHANWEKIYDFCSNGNDDYRAYFSVWSRDLEIADEFVSTMKGKNFMVAGHTPTCNFNPWINELKVTDNRPSVIKTGSIFLIDCGAAYVHDKEIHGRLACLRLDDQKIFYSKG